MAAVDENKRVETAQFIKSMLIELRTMGQASQCDMLVYLLEMAMMEAADIAAGKGSQGRRHTPASGKPVAPTARQLAALYMTGQLDA